MAHMDPEQLSRGLITASTGNHGQSVANACRIFGAKAVVVVPEGPTPESAVHAESGRTGPLPRRQLRPGPRVQRAVGQGGRIPLRPRRQRAATGAGVATYAMEILEEFPEVEYILVPLGGRQRGRRLLHCCQGRQPRRQGNCRPVPTGSGGVPFLEEPKKSAMRP